jgi:hypothetical protein
MRSYEERAKDFIKEVFPYIEECERPHEVQNRIMEYNARNSRKVRVNHGIARIALITSDYVVKFDYDPDEVACVGGGEAEVRLYAQAEHDGFAYLFAKVTRYEYSGRRFYIMPRIYGISESNWYCADHFMTDEERAWCDSHNLSDLHCNNYGFRKGKVCIVDYACTCEETYSCSSSYHSSSSRSSERS